MYCIGSLESIRSVEDYVRSVEGRVNISQYVDTLYERGGGSNERRQNLSDDFNSVMDFKESLNKVNSLLEGYYANSSMLEEFSRESMETIFQKLVTSTGFVEYENILLLQLHNEELKLKSLTSTIRRVYHASLNKYKWEHGEMITNLRDCEEEENVVDKWKMKCLHYINLKY